MPPLTVFIYMSLKDAINNIAQRKNEMRSDAEGVRDALGELRPVRGFIRNRIKRMTR